MGVLRSSVEFTLRKLGRISDIGNTITDSQNIWSTQSETRYTSASSKRTKIPSSGTKTRTGTSVTKASEIKKSGRTRFSAGGIEMVNTEINTPTSVEESVKKLTEAEWAARTSLRVGSTAINRDSAGATRFIVAKDGQTLTKNIRK